jgi:hypothetical protein
MVTGPRLTLPKDHGNCSVGRFTHGLAGAADIIGKSDVAALLEVGWVRRSPVWPSYRTSQPQSATDRLVKQPPFPTWCCSE